MKDGNQTKPPSASFVKSLYQEIDIWLGSEIISEEQAYFLRSRYPEPKPADWRGRLVTVLSIMAASLLGMGVILFFASNWDAIPRYAKLFLSASMLVTVYATGYILRFNRDYPRVGDALIFLGTILYGSAIFLVAQAFHIQEHFPNGLLLWAVGILAMALINRSPYIICLFTLVICAWSGMETFHFKNFGIFLPLVILCLIFPLAYKYKNRLAVMFAVGSLGYFLFEGAIYEADMINDFSVFVYLNLLLVFGLFLWVLGEVQRLVPKYSRYVPIYMAPALLISFSILYAFSFPSFFEEMMFDNDISGYIVPFFTLALLAGSIACLTFLKIKKDLQTGDLLEAITAVAIMIIFSVFSYLIAPIYEESIGMGVVPLAIASFFNILLFSLCVAMIVQGYRKGRHLLINVGLFMFSLTVVTRYIDIFWDMMPTSLFFIIGGFLLLAGGIFLERQRRKLLGGAKEVSS
jgi:uncharacterized membrane protein